jgi:hypothetical protein
MSTIERKEYERINSGENAEEPNQENVVNGAKAPEVSQTFLEKAKKNVEAVAESSQAMVVMGILTMWTLFQGDIRLAATEKDADLPFQVIISICFFLFATETLLQCFYKEGYLNLPSWNGEEQEDFIQKWKRRFTFGSFYFWMDIVATFTLVMDMDWMLDSATQQAFQGGGAQSAKGASAIRVGARIGRVIRLVRMVRLARIGKLYKYANQVMCSPNLKDQNIVGLNNDEDELEESKVGTAIADITNRR